MFHTVFARIFVKRVTVKLKQSVLVLGKMRGNPVQNNAYARGVKRVDKVSEIVGRSETRGRRVIAADLIAP